ncbi:DUF2335 domain-containing protein [Streptomyces sp. NPDC014734]|uniref:DUF2335 domain-containing protein n=1 Tax=Streptomyces sp. NPDC014734 TaxID=3364886 RepID=UPI0037007E50
MERSWAGPLPDPRTMAQYEQILPGAADRILAMAETAATGRIKIEERQAEAEISAASTGQGSALFLTICAMIGAAAFFMAGKNIAGGAFLSVPVVMLIRSFITRT